MALPGNKHFLWKKQRSVFFLEVDLLILVKVCSTFKAWNAGHVGRGRSLVRERASPIMKTSAKSNLSHGEANAGMAGGLVPAVLFDFFVVCI